MYQARKSTSLITVPCPLHPLSHNSPLTRASISLITVDGRALFESPTYCLLIPLDLETSTCPLIRSTRWLTNMKQKKNRHLWIRGFNNFYHDQTQHMYLWLKDELREDASKPRIKVTTFEVVCKFRLHCFDMGHDCKINGTTRYIPNFYLRIKQKKKIWTQLESRIWIYCYMHIIYCEWDWSRYQLYQQIINIMI